MPDYLRNSGANVIDNLVLRVARLEAQMGTGVSGNRLVTIDRQQTATIPTPVEGQLAVETADEMQKYYSNGKWRQMGAFEIKVVDDATTVTTGEGVVIMAVPQSLNSAILRHVAAFVTTVSSSGLPTIQIRNVTTGHDMLSTAITIDASEFTSYTAATPPVINASFSTVSTGDLLAIDVDVAGTGAKGLGVSLEFA